jgi:hypothetical protein
MTSRWEKEGQEWAPGTETADPQLWRMATDDSYPAFRGQGGGGSRQEWLGIVPVHCRGLTDAEVWAIALALTAVPRNAAVRIVTDDVRLLDALQRRRRMDTLPVVKTPLWTLMKVRKNAVRSLLDRKPCAVRSKKRRATRQKCQRACSQTCRGLSGWQSAPAESLRYTLSSMPRSANLVNLLSPRRAAEIHQ